ncbi:hypothetical protein LTR17_008426 [Elasticomyces elasticus]|nr:hypothetical protein LTR17_008426 [Elasticomyces elasticus]
MAIKNRPPGLRYILLLLLFIFGTQVYSLEFSQDLGGYDSQAVNGSHLDTVHEFAKRQDDSSDGGSCCITKYQEAITKTSESQPALQKRVTPADYTIYEDAFYKGSGRRLALVCGNQYSPSPFANAGFGAPSDNGWVANKNNGDFGDPATVPARQTKFDQQSIDVVNWLETQAPGSIASNTKANMYYEWQHHNGGTSFGIYPGFPATTDFGATNAVYANYMNPKGGLIICYQNYGPDYAIRTNAQHFPPVVIGPAPPMKQLSDILFFQWRRACEERTMRNLGDIQYIFQRKIADVRTIQVVDAVTTFPNEGLLTWPGRDYIFDPFTPGLRPSESNIAHALLGTPQGASVAFMLLQYEAHLGRLVPSKVRLWAGSDYASDRRDRNMMFWISPRPDQDPSF